VGLFVDTTLVFQLQLRLRSNTIESSTAPSLARMYCHDATDAFWIDSMPNPY
jgi:hypothetical protein